MEEEKKNGGNGTEEPTADQDVKSFHDLITEVQDRGLCGKCGGCVSFCSAGDLNALEIGEDDTPRFVDEDKCLKCGICYLICPQIRALNPELRDSFGWRPPIGPYRSITSARTTDKRIMEVCTDGGVVTSLLVYALKRNLIQGAIVSRKIGPFARRPMMITDPDDLIETAGSHFEESSHLEEVGSRYATYSPAIREVKGLGKSDLRRVALVGTPCQIYTVRKMQYLKVLPADIITLTIGLFCMENFSFGDEARKKLEKSLEVNLANVKKLNIKDDVIVTLTTGETIHVPFEVVDEIARPACMGCPDFANDYADISVGGLGSPDGYTTTLIRTLAGERLYNGALRHKEIEDLPFPDKETMRIHKTKAMAKIISFATRKKERSGKYIG
jgi:coenzyme F420 hydrogenase subunit beta